MPPPLAARPLLIVPILFLSWLAPAGAESADILVGRSNLKVTVGENPKVQYVARDATGTFTKGAGVDASAVSAEFFLASGGDAASVLAMPLGAYDGTSGWQIDGDREAEYRNRLAPGGASAVRKASVRTGKVVKLKARATEGFAPMVGSTDPVFAGMCLYNGADTYCYCSVFDDCTIKATRGRDRLKCKAGGVDPKCTAVTRGKTAFSAQAGGTDGLLSQNDDALNDVVSGMTDFGFDTFHGYFLPDPAIPGFPFDDFLANPPWSDPTPPQGRFTIDGQDALVSEPIRFGPSDVIVIRGVYSMSKDTTWSYHVAVEHILQDATDTTGTPRRASLGEISINRASIVVPNPDWVTDYAFTFITADQESLDLVLDAVRNSDFNLLTGAEVNVLPVPDIMIDDGQGGTIPVLQGDPAAYPQAEISIRMLQTPLHGRSSEIITRPNPNHFPFLIFTRDPSHPPGPRLATSQDSSSPAHEDSKKKAARRFDSLVKRVVRTFERPPYNLSLVSDTPFVHTNGTESTFGIGVDVIEGGAGCLSAGLDCGYDDPVSLYSWPGDSFTVSDDDYYVVVGLDYTRLAGFGGPLVLDGRLTLYNAPTGTAGGFQQVSDVASDFSTTPPSALAGNTGGLPLPIDETFAGSMPSRLRSLTPSAFMLPISRSAGAQPGVRGVELDASLFDPSEPFLLIGRLSLNPDTGTRPDPKQVVPWRLLRFEVSS